jgi:hypothetical protein
VNLRSLVLLNALLNVLGGADAAKRNESREKKDEIVEETGWKGLPR